MLTFVGNWAGAIYWWGAMLEVLFLGDGVPQQQQEEQISRSHDKQDQDLIEQGKRMRRERRRDAWLQHVSILTAFTCASVLATEIACLVLRQHLFIWTVFSPKFLFVGAWAVGMHLMVNVVGGAMVVAVGEWYGKG